MGTWGMGNFDNDAACDLAAQVSATVDECLKVPEFVEDIELTMAAVAIHLTLARECKGPLLKQADLVGLCDGVLELFDARFKDLSTDSDLQREGRQVLERTFAEYLRLIQTRTT